MWTSVWFAADEHGLKSYGLSNCVRDHFSDKWGVATQVINVEKESHILWNLTKV